MTKDPALILTYGPSGAGKTTDLGYSFPNGIFIAARGALQPVRSLCGYEPHVMQAQIIDDATKFLEKLATVKDHDFDAVIVDDFSFLAEQQFAVYDKRFSGFTLWGKLRDSALAFRNAARYANVHVILNCWEQAPKIRQDGTRIRGGPMLSGKLPEQIPAMCDMVLRCAHEPMRKPWPGVYRCHYSTDYVMKDRFNIATRLDPAPMNLAEILRAAGYDISRHTDLGWQEEIVEKVCTGLLAGGPVAETVNATYKELLDGGVTPAAARWTMRDALDRSVIRRALSVTDSVFIS
jgi:hypothetical protein